MKPKCPCHIFLFCFGGLPWQATFLGQATDPNQSLKRMVLPYHASTNSYSNLHRGSQGSTGRGPCTGWRCRSHIPPVLTWCYQRHWFVYAACTTGIDGRACCPTGRSCGQYRLHVVQEVFWYSPWCESRCPPALIRPFATSITNWECEKEALCCSSVLVIFRCWYVGRIVPFVTYPGVGNCGVDDKVQ